MEMFLHAAGIKMRQIPAVGGGPAMMMVLGNNADMWASVTSIAAPHVGSSKVRVLASWGQGKHPTFPDAPTLKDSGYDVEFYVWSGVFVQKGVPAETQKIIRDAIRASINSEEFKSAMRNLQIPVDYRDAPEFKAFLERDAAAIREAIRRMGKIEDTK
jgi:tripartite-type tricarboxylate transporter receptor subunit TctC